MRRRWQHTTYPTCTGITCLCASKSFFSSSKDKCCMSYSLHRHCNIHSPSFCFVSSVVYTTRSSDHSQFSIHMVLREIFFSSLLLPIVCIWLRWLWIAMERKSRWHHHIDTQTTHSLAHTHTYTCDEMQITKRTYRRRDDDDHKFYYLKTIWNISEPGKKQFINLCNKMLYDRIVCVLSEHTHTHSQSA